MTHICPVCGYEWRGVDGYDERPEICDDCENLDFLLWQRAIIKARKLGIISEPVNWAKLAEEE